MEMKDGSTHGFLDQREKNKLNHSTGKVILTVAAPGKTSVINL